MRRCAAVRGFFGAGAGRKGFTSIVDVGGAGGRRCDSGFCAVPVWFFLLFGFLNVVMSVHPQNIVGNQSADGRPIHAQGSIATSRGLAAVGVDLVARAALNDAAVVAYPSAFVDEDHRNSDNHLPAPAPAASSPEGHLGRLQAEAQRLLAPADRGALLETAV